jgi:antitoxin PrlF
VNKALSATQIAERLMVRPEGATMDEMIAATGGPRYGVLKRLQGRGYRIRRAKEGRTTRYFAEPPAAPAYEATVTSQGQVTIPKEIRGRLGVSAGGKLRFVLESDDRVVVRPVDLSIRRLFGILGKPPRSATLDEMDEGIRRAAVGRYLRSKR